MKDKEKEKEKEEEEEEIHTKKQTAEVILEQVEEYEDDIQQEEEEVIVPSLNNAKELIFNLLRTSLTKRLGDYNNYFCIKS